MSATKWPKLDRYEWDARFSAETDMSETLETEFRPIWLRRRTHHWHWYDWETSTQTCTDMTETLEKIVFLHFDFTRLRLRQDKN